MSSVFAGPPFVVDAPLPVPPPHRLLDVATQVPDGGDPHWRNGVQVWPWGTCQPVQGVAPCLSPPDSEKLPSGAFPMSEFGAFTAYQQFSCTARSIGDEQEFTDRVIRFFEAGESLAVEEQLAKGTYQPLNPYLGAGPNTPVFGVAQEPDCALALLEQEIGRSGTAGLIHVSPAVAAAFSFEGGLVERSSGLWTLRGTRVVVGDGYIDAVPDGQAAIDPVSENWAFASGPVSYFRGGIELVPGSIREALDRTDNTVTFIVERDYLVFWDTCVFSAVLVQFCTP